MSTSTYIKDQAVAGVIKSILSTFTPVAVTTKESILGKRGRSVNHVATTKLTLAQTATVELGLKKRKVGLALADKFSRTIDCPTPTHKHHSGKKKTGNSLSPAAPLVTLRFVDTRARKDNQRRAYGVHSVHEAAPLVRNHPRSIMQALTAWYYVPGRGTGSSSSTSPGKQHRVNYIETTASTFAVQQIGTTAPPPSTKLLLVGQGADVFVADLTWSYDGYNLAQLDHARNRTKTAIKGQDNAGNKGAKTNPLADVADRLVRHDGLKDAKGAVRGVLPSRFMSLESWVEMVKLLSTRTPQKARNKPALGQDPMKTCRDILVQLGNKSSRVNGIADAGRRAAKDAKHLVPLRERFLKQISPLMARDDELAREEQVVPAFKEDVVAKGIPGLSQVELQTLFDQGSEMALDVEPATSTTPRTSTIDQNAVDLYQNRLHGLLSVVQGMATVVENRTGDALEHLFTKIATDSPFSEYLGAARVDASGNTLPPLRVTTAALREASNDPRYRCRGGGDNCHVVKKHSDNLVKALKLLSNSQQKGGHLVDTDSWLDKVKRATANMGDRQRVNEVPIRFSTVFPGAMNTWPTCREYVNALVNVNAAGSRHEVDSRFKAMGTSVRVSGYQATTDMTYMTSQDGRTGKLDSLKWLWQLYASINNEPTPAGFVQTLLDAPLKPVNGVTSALTFGECLIRGYLCWLSRACLVLKGEEQRSGALPRGITVTKKAASQQPAMVIYGQPLSDVIAALEHFGQREFWPTALSQPLRPTGTSALKGLAKKACARYIWEIGTWKVISEAGLRTGYVEMVNICTKPYRESLEPQLWDGQPELRRGFWFIHWESVGSHDPLSNIVLEYNDSKTVGAEQHEKRDKFVKNSFKTIIRRAGTWLKPEYRTWLPLFIDAYYLICGSIDRPYTSKVHSKTNLNLYEDLHCKNFVTPAMPKYQKDFAKLTQLPNQKDSEYQQLYESQMGDWKASGKTRDYTKHLAAVRAKGAEPTCWPPRPHKWDLTGSNARYNNNTSRWLETMLEDHCRLMGQGQRLTLRPAYVKGDKAKRYYHFQDIDDEPCDFLGHPQPKKRSKKAAKKEVPATKTTEYVFQTDTRLSKLVGHPIDKANPAGEKWSKHRVDSLKLTLNAIAQRQLIPSVTFAGRQHNVSVYLGWQDMLLSVPSVTARHGAAELLQADVDSKLASEAHLGITTVRQAYTKILQEIPLGHPTRFNDLINWRVHGHPITQAVWTTTGKLRVPGDESTRYYIEAWPETFVPTLGETDTDVWIRIQGIHSQQRLTIPEQNANIFYLSIVKFGIQWILKNQNALRSFKDGSRAIFEWLDSLKRVPTISPHDASQSGRKQSPRLKKRKTIESTTTTSMDL